MLSQEHLKRVLHYNKDTGMFTWKVKVNTRINPGDIAGSTTTSGAGRQCRRITIDSISYASARLAWLYVTGKEPELQIDHEDGNSLNDKWLNLRDVSSSTNSKNQKLRSSNTSGCMGVGWDKRESCWQARINAAGQQKHLGHFANLEEAIKVRKAAEKENDYHINHGRKNEQL